MRVFKVFFLFQGIWKKSFFLRYKVPWLICCYFISLFAFLLDFLAPRWKILKNGRGIVVVIGRAHFLEERGTEIEICLRVRFGCIDSLWLRGVNIFVLPRRDPSMVPRIICGCGRALSKALVIFLITPSTMCSTRAMRSVEFHGSSPRAARERERENCCIIWSVDFLINQKIALK